MKFKLSLILLLTCFISFNCKKYFEAAAPNNFSGTTYNYLGTWNTNGVPNYLVTPSDTVSAAETNFINSTLPEGHSAVTAHPELFSASSSQANLNLTQKSTVYISFVHDGSGNNNVIGFFTYPTANPPTAANQLGGVTIIFPSAKSSGTNGFLPLGSKVKIGTFNAGTSIGFILLQSGWNPTTSTVNTSDLHFATIDALNPETDPTLQRHAILLNYQGKTLVCFEDSNRQSTGTDSDFNDVIVAATIVPAP